MKLYRIMENTDVWMDWFLNKADASYIMDEDLEKYPDRELSVEAYDDDDEVLSDCCWADIFDGMCMDCKNNI